MRRRGGDTIGVPSAVVKEGWRRGVGEGSVVCRMGVCCAEGRRGKSIRGK